MTQYLDQLYFDRESKQMHYVLGAAYGCASYDSWLGITFRSNKRNLIEIIKDEIKSKHIIEDKRPKHHSYWIETDNADYMRYRLHERGVAEDKHQRKFPKNIKEEYLSHFVRGFFDAKANVSSKGGRTHITFNFNNRFLLGLHGILVKYAGVTRSKPTDDYLTYGHSDSLKIHDFIYSDWKYIRRNGLYLPSKKRKFNFDYEPKEYPSTIRYHKKIERAKKLLLKGLPHKETAEAVGYSNVFSFYRGFKNLTGMTTREFQGKKRENK